MAVAALRADCRAADVCRRTLTMSNGWPEENVQPASLFSLLRRSDALTNKNLGHASYGSGEQVLGRLQRSSARVSHCFFPAAASAQTVAYSLGTKA